MLGLYTAEISIFQIYADINDNYSRKFIYSYLSCLITLFKKLNNYYTDAYDKLLC